MKNKKGFTLIELLAVIVILGVIMIIAVPSVTKYIEKSKREGFTKTASGIIDASRLYYANEYGQDSNENIEFICTTEECKSDDSKKLELTKKPVAGNIKIFSDGEIIACFTKNSWYAVKNINDKDVTFGEGTCEYNDESKSYTVLGTVSQKTYEEISKKYNDLKALLNESNITAGDVAEGKKAYSNGAIITGTASGLKLIGSVNSTTAKTFNIKEMYPDDYNKYTENNFVLVVNESGGEKELGTISYSNGLSNWPMSAYSYLTIDKTYTDGILSVTSKVRTRLYYNYYDTYVGDQSKDGEVSISVYLK